MKEPLELRIKELYNYVIDWKLEYNNLISKILNQTNPNILEIMKYNGRINTYQDIKDYLLFNFDDIIQER